MLCDRFGARRIMVITQMGNIAAQVGMGFATDIYQCIFFNSLKGVFGTVSTVMFSLTASLVPAGEFKTALSYQMSAQTIASLISPGIGGVLVSMLGYRLTFMSSSLIFISTIPLLLIIKVPSPTGGEDETKRFQVSDLKAIAPDAFSLILVGAAISFIVPTIPWFLSSLGTSPDQLITFTALTTTLNGVAYGIATPFLTKTVTDRWLPILSIGGSAVIFSTAFVTNSYQFIGLRVVIGSIQAGIPPSLLGGKSGRKGTAIGILNSARFMGSAIGPYMATTILGNGLPPRPLYMFAVMAGVSLLSAFFLYLTHTRPSSKIKQKSQS
jgi:MFS family permease